GLATAQQLIAEDANGWFLPGASIRDRPRFPWRGLMLDVCRHWMPPEVIRRELDGMALVKLNVLHLHLSDDQGFRIEVEGHPELSGRGSDGHAYTQAQLRDLIAYAADRCIRVVPEFDLPGHATSWLVSHPELACAPGPYRIERHWGVFDPVFDPTNPATYRLIGEVFREMAALFPDRCFHVGGDENNGAQWSANPRIEAFIRRRRLKDNAGLQVYFARRLQGILDGLGKRMVGWDEILDPKLEQSAVIESWRGPDALAGAARLGYDGILAHGVYIDLCFPAADYYATDPAPADLAPAERAHVLGGEATMWSEWVTPDTIDSRIWPRTAAIAERLWSPAGVRNEADMYRRLACVSRRLDEIGMRHLRYRPPLIDRLLGGERNPAARAALVALIDAIEPVTGYERGRQQPDFDQWTPLIGLADAARPDCPARLGFVRDAARFLASPGDRTETAARRLRATLLAWRAAGAAIGGLAPRLPGLAPAAPLAVQWADASSVGLEALGILAGRATPSGWRAASLLRLGRDEEPHDAVQIGAIVGAVRALVLAAAQDASFLHAQPHAPLPSDL
ncbi:MAG: family 20 glycosylhydrolase, partial [Opitutaceae bacterium]